MFADWDCIFRKHRAGGDGRDEPGNDGVGESIISALGIIVISKDVDGGGIDYEAELLAVGISTCPAHVPSGSPVC